MRKSAEERRAEILSEAARIALGEGLERVTLRAVAEPLGVRPSLIGHYFPAVEDLVVDAFVLAVTGERDWLFGVEAGAGASTGVGAGVGAGLRARDGAEAGADQAPPFEQMAGFVRRAESPEALELCRLWLNARHLARFMPRLAHAIDEQETLDRERMVALIERGVAAGSFVTDDPVGASTRIYMAVDAIGVYANNAQPFEHEASRHFVADVAAWSLGVDVQRLR
ncbi:TetR family transcriptional regulator [Leucobacter sp. USHLN153]|uniref:TetR family transcriptional regulator n=1 Tax=Leucobacter sp. USHLN153 TaxID=3081268 RepID=UPI003016CD3C